MCWYRYMSGYLWATDSALPHHSMTIWRKGGGHRCTDTLSILHTASSTKDFNSRLCIEILAIDRESTTIHEACFGKKTPVAALLAQ